MSTPFDGWLRDLAAAKKGPATLYAHRNTDYYTSVVLAAEMTGAVLTGQVRLYPDQPGAALATFTINPPIVADGYSTFEIYLAKATLAALPADPDLSGEVALAFDFLLTPSGGPTQLLFGGTFLLLGGITQ